MRPVVACVILTLIMMAMLVPGHRSTRVMQTPSATIEMFQSATSPAALVTPSTLSASPTNIPSGAVNSSPGSLTDESVRETSTPSITKVTEPNSDTPTEIPMAHGMLLEDPDPPVVPTAILSATPTIEPSPTPTQESTMVPEPTPIPVEPTPVPQEPTPVPAEPTPEPVYTGSWFAAGQAAYYSADFDWGRWEEIYWIHANEGRVTSGATGPSPYGYHCVHAGIDLVGVPLILRANGVEIVCITADMVWSDHKSQWYSRWAIELSWTAFIALGLDYNNYVEVYSP